MFVDAGAAFVLPGAPLSLVAGAGINIPSAVYDLSGFGVGVTDTNTLGVSNTGVITKFGTDFGIGALKPQLVVTIGTALTTANSATLNLALQAAADDGTNNPSTWQTLEETGALTAAQCAANTRIMRLSFPPNFPANLRPRFMRLLAQVPAATNFTAGTIASAFITVVPDEYGIGQAARNYWVA